MSQLRADHLSLSRQAQPSPGKTILSGTKVKSRASEATHTWVHVLALPLAMTRGKCYKSLRALVCEMGIIIYLCFLRMQQDNVFKVFSMLLGTQLVSSKEQLELFLHPQSPGLQASLCSGKVNFQTRIWNLQAMGSLDRPSLEGL